jgi:murein DD-endopeptidase MepM/ murein hydrolase activator NlpD
LKKKYFKLRMVFLILVILIAAVVFYFSLSTKVNENTDDYVYDLPLKQGTSYKVVQGYGGMFSHKYKAALDFAMRVGTPIHAAREGYVYSFKDDSDEGGPLPKYTRKANYVIIMHRDGSFGCYWHLKKDGVVVKTGNVKKGQLIGYSGYTGFVLQPHLHFAVKRKFSYAKDAFVRTKFMTSDGVQFLKQGNRYRKP